MWLAFLIITNFEDHEEEIRRIVSIEWIIGRRPARGIPGVESQYFARCLLICQDHQEYQGEEDCADYAIPSLHLMITACPKPYNNGFILREYAS